jgi:biotin carboxylase
MSPLHFAFVESNTTGTGRLAVERLLAEGSRVTFLTRAPQRYPFLSRGQPLLEVLEVETNEPEAVAEELEALRQRTPVDALLTFSTFYVPTVALLAERFGYRYLNARTARICHEKHLARQVMKEAGLPVPPFWVIASEEEARRVAAEAVYPCVVKPPAESGSTGVRLVKNADELLAHYRFLASRKVNERGQPLVGSVLVEGLLSGPEFSVETVTLERGRTQVIGVTEKHLSAPPHFVELGHDFPATLETARRVALEQAVLAALDAVGFDLGPAHTEIRFTPTGPVVVEINPRLAGGMIPELVRHALGVDLLSALLDGMLGRTPRLTPTRAETASIRFITSRSTGRLARQPSLEAARQIPLVREVTFEKPAGFTVRPPESAADRLGFVISCGEAPAQVALSAEEALRLIPLDLDS